MLCEFVKSHIVRATVLYCYHHHYYLVACWVYIQAYWLWSHKQAVGYPYNMATVGVKGLTEAKQKQHIWVTVGLIWVHSAWQDAGVLVWLLYISRASRSTTPHPPLISWPFHSRRVAVVHSQSLVTFSVLIRSAICNPSHDSDTL